MQRLFFLMLVSSCALFAQVETRTFNTKVMTTGGMFGGPAVQGAPYSATIVTESVQTLADGNRIVQRTTGNVARDSQGRTRNEAALPMIGNLSAAKAPHLVFLMDPVAKTSYTLNLDDKTAHQAGGGVMGVLGSIAISGTTAGLAPALEGLRAKMGAIQATPGPVGFATSVAVEQGPSQREDLGAKIIEGVTAQGVRTTRTIPAGEIGNDKAIEVVTEIWTSPELKTIVYSKRSDPRSGEQTLQLTNILRSEPDPSMFTVPADFKTLDAGQPGQDVFYYKREE